MKASLESKNGAAGLINIIPIDGLGDGCCVSYDHSNDEIFTMLCRFQNQFPLDKTLPQPKASDCGLEEPSSAPPRFVCLRSPFLYIVLVRNKSPSECGATKKEKIEYS